MHVPWRRVASWHCIACGRCCREYRVKLNFHEYLRLKPTGFVEERNGKFYIKKIGKFCPFQIGRFCTLQNNLKPMACKLFPFIIRDRGEDDALFEYKGEEYYIYADTFCPNLVLKKDKKPSKQVEALVIEAIKLHRREQIQVKNLTSSILNSKILKLQQHHHHLMRV